MIQMKDKTDEIFKMQNIMLTEIKSLKGDNDESHEDWTFSLIQLIFLGVLLLFKA